LCRILWIWLVRGVLLVLPGEFLLLVVLLNGLEILLLGLEPGHLKLEGW
jgi:hypothetical protein